MDILNQILLFLSQTVIVVLGFAAIVVIILMAALKNKKQTEIEVDIINDKFEDQTLALKETLLTDDEFKAEKKAFKEKCKQEEKLPTHKPKAFVIQFLDGDIKASQVEQFRQEVTSILLVAKPEDEVIVCVESPGGAVHGYGLAASQIDRFKKAGLKVTVCVDKIAASGGYMMACVADHIVSAPFAIIGSIGVVAQVPNFNKLLKKYDVDYKEYTAGDYKRTVSLFGEITEKGEKKFNEQLESTHTLFKSFVQKYRPQMDLSKVATGEYWFGEDALKLGLVDTLGTSDDFIMTKTKTHKVVKLTIEKKQKFSDKIAEIMSLGLSQTAQKIVEKLTVIR